MRFFSSFILALGFLTALEQKAFALASENAASNEFPYRRLMPDPVVLPPFHDTIRDNPALLRKEEAIGGQVLFAPSFGGGTHGLDSGFAWGNGKIGTGILFESNLGSPSTMDGLSTAFSAGKGVFSMGATFKIATFSPFQPMAHLGIHFGKSDGSQFSLTYQDIGPRITDSHLSLGYGFIREDAFNFSLFFQLPGWGYLSNGIYTFGTSTSIYMNRWTVGFLATYGINIGSAVSASGTGSSGGISCDLGFSKWMGDHFNFQVRLSSALSVAVGLTIAWSSP